VKAAIEREIKLGAQPGFVLPDLEGAVPGATTERGDERVLDATYYDVHDLRLIRDGVTVRHRTGDADGQGTWTVKLPDVAGSLDGGLARAELELDGPPGPIPAEIAALVASRVRTGMLVPVARLRTTRRRLLLAGPDGSAIAEVDDDEVDVLEDGTLVASFREVEVELAAGASSDVLAAIVRRLRDAGAGEPDPTPKLARALGPRALLPPELAPVALGRRATAADVLRRAFASSVRRIVEHDPAVRDGDPEGVHQARVGTRRLRSDLRTFRPLLDRAWADPLRDELAWLAEALGVVRDADVLLVRLRDAAASLPPGDHALAENLLGRLVAERSEARERLLRDVLASERYLRLLDALVAGAASPRLDEKAEGRAKDVVPGLVRRPWKKLRREVAALGDDPSDEALHRVRIRAKRARYAAEVAVPVFGSAATKLAQAIGALQDVLGDHHDAVVAESWLRTSAAGPYTDGAGALVAGEMIGLERAEAARLRRAWPPAWKAAAKAGRVRWLS
jgi:CHAD domain-containing protein